MKVIMLALKIFAAALTAIVLVVGGYVLYVVLQYSRIEDYISLEVQGEATADVSDKDSFKILTYNIGFGAYSTDFSFFMDSGAMKDGSKVYGTGSKAADKTVAEKIRRERWAWPQLQTRILFFCRKPM